MANVKPSNVSQYAASSGHSAYATITCSDDLTVTVKITSNTGCGWRIRGANPDTATYASGSSSKTQATFNGVDGKSYAFQIYCPVEGSYTYGEIFTIDLDSGDDSGEGGNPDIDYEPYRNDLYVNQGEGTILHVRRSWPETRLCWEDLHTGDSVYFDYEDTFYISVEVLDGYNLDYYSVNGRQLGYDLYNFTEFEPSGRPPGDTNIYYRLSGNTKASVTSTATPKQYKLSASAETGAYITVTRKSSKKSGAPLGLLSNGAEIYHLDVLEISVGTEAGYGIVDTIVSGCIENDEGSFTVIGNTNVTVTTELMGLVYIDNGTSFVPCLVFIDNGSDWEQCIPYVDNGTSWSICG